jgi:hypothetical protein
MVIFSKLLYLAEGFDRKGFREYIRLKKRVFEISKKQSLQMKLEKIIVGYIW